MPFPTKQQPYPDDIFADTRMSFGDHIEELRKHLLRAIYGLLVVLLGGIGLDALGEYLNIKSLGVGRPMLEVIIEPAESQVRAFYARRNERAATRLVDAASDPAEVERVKAKWEKAERNTDALTDAELMTLRGAPEPMPVLFPTKAFEDAFGIPAKPGTPEHLPVTIKVFPAYINYVSNRGETLLENRQYMRTQNPQEAMVVYFKVAILCSVVLASPWLFYQLWSFIAAGLYPHERAYVYKFLGPSIGLFITGVLLCQFVVLPGAVKALIAFNNWVELDPDLRLNEWLGFALVLPVVFGISFQTPLVMFFFNRIGTFGWQDYWQKWRYAFMILALFAAIITPTPDAVTMCYLFVPMFGLYMIGVAVCKYFPPAHESVNEEAEQVAV
ncbi:MAG: twin-arginine translocase subunit TatC [Gemmataceae bacterium]